MSKPQQYSDEKIVSALRETKGMVYLAAQKVGCNPDTIYERAKTSPAVKDAIRTERGRVIDTAELKLFSAMMNSEPWAIRLTLASLGRSRGYGNSDAAELEQLHRKPSIDPDLAKKIAREAVEEARRNEPDLSKIVILPPTE